MGSYDAWHLNIGCYLTVYTVGKSGSKLCNKQTERKSEHQGRREDEADGLMHIRDHVTDFLHGQGTGLDGPSGCIATLWLYRNQDWKESCSGS